VAAACRGSRGNTGPAQRAAGTARDTGETVEAARGTSTSAAQGEEDVGRTCVSAVEQNLEGRQLPAKVWQFCYR